MTNWQDIDGTCDLRDGNWLADHTQRVVIDAFHAGWQPFTSRVCQWSMMGLMLFNTFTNDLDNDIESPLISLLLTLIWVVRWTCCKGEPFYRDMDRMEELASENWM